MDAYKGGITMRGKRLSERTMGPAKLDIRVELLARLDRGGADRGNG